MGPPLRSRGASGRLLSSMMASPLLSAASFSSLNYSQKIPGPRAAPRILERAGTQAV
jgi:hypothetical protein